MGEERGGLRGTGGGVEAGVGTRAGTSDGRVCRVLPGRERYLRVQRCGGPDGRRESSDQAAATGRTRCDPSLDGGSGRGSVGGDRSVADYVGPLLGGYGGSGRIPGV